MNNNMQRHDNGPVQQQSQPQRQMETQEVTVAPLVDIYQNDNEFLLIADLPGVSDEGLRIDYERGQISIEGRPMAQPHGGQQLFGQRARPVFVRSFSIPGTIDVGRIEATLKNGVLEVKLPKQEQAKPRQIPVKNA
jgi:HSP20 family molecular chaperone IbpA